MTEIQVQVRESTNASIFSRYFWSEFKFGPLGRTPYYKKNIKLWSKRNLALERLKENGTNNKKEALKKY